ncbi:MAG TPA: hypothetical protein VJ552_12940 [Sediminibacterium sp.]|nr:hypothetical protein [Sediminibacterium sp.]
MTTKIIRAEHLLWMAPVLFVFIIYLSSAVDSMMVFYLGEYFMISYSLITLFFLAVLLVPYLLHILLRRIGARNLVISWLHILLSFLMAASVVFIFNKNLPININWRYHVGELGSFGQWNYYNSLGLLITRLFIAIQLLFSLYGLGSVALHYGSAIRNRNRDASDGRENDYEVSEADFSQQMTA